MKVQTQTLAELRKLSVPFKEMNGQKCGYQIEIAMQNDQVRAVAKCLLKQGYYLVFVSAVHVAPEIEMIYQFAHFDEPSRIKARVSAGETSRVPTISDIFQGANWHERETHDFFGVDFAGHPNLTPLILAEEDADLKPLLKDEKALKSLEAIRWSEEDTEAENPQ
jgi:NADH-quinone oxidoreductase subunit C